MPGSEKLALGQSGLTLGFESLVFQMKRWDPKMIKCPEILIMARTILLCSINAY